MLNALCNRAGQDGKWQLPADGWHQLAPAGTYPLTVEGEDGKPRTIVQELDEAAFAAMCQAFANRKGGGDLLVDYDHFSLDLGKSSAAAGWLQELANRGADGLWGRIRWTAAGRSAIEDGTYRYLSPVFDGASAEPLGGARVRPRSLVNVALTNDHNLKGMVPLSNRGSAAESKEKAVKEKLTKLLGLAADAADDAVLAGVEALANRAGQVEPLTQKVKEFEKKDAERQVDADLAEFADVIANRDEVKAQLLANRESGLKLLKALKPGKTEDGKRKTDVLPNRRSGKLPESGGEDADAAAAKAESARAVRIRTRAGEIQARERCTYSEAWARAEQAEG